jgi:hypothetical protein
MALDQSALLELSEALRSADSGELMRRLLHTMLQALIDAEATAQIGAGPHERTDTRTTQRNGTRDKLVASTAGAAITSCICGSTTRCHGYIGAIGCLAPAVQGSFVVAAGVPVSRVKILGRGRLLSL